jgi:hypothetical protein
MVWPVRRQAGLMGSLSTASSYPQMQTQQQMLARLMAAWALVGAGPLAWQGLH